MIDPVRKITVGSPRKVHEVDLGTAAGIAGLRKS
jgi:hypothetical protein